MSGQLMAEFESPALLSATLAQVTRAGHQALDAFTPYPIEGLSHPLGVRTSRIRPIMLLSGLGAGIAAFALQWYSAVIAYPIVSGGRPAFSWQVFGLVPFEFGIFAAALGGVIAFLRASGLPRLHHPVFETIGFERATQDRFFLLASAKSGENGLRELRTLLEHAGAVVVAEVRQ